jgi:hypothetical protein
MKNKLAYLGFIGFLGFLGLLDSSFILGETSFTYYFFAFFPSFLYAKVIPDELFILHVRIAATKSFFVALVMGVLLILSIVIFANVHVIRLCVVLAVVIPLGTFVINLEIFERREKKGMQDAT